MQSNRSPDRYVAEGCAIQRDPGLHRFAENLDFFRHADQDFTDAFQSDRSTLVSAGHNFETQISQLIFTARRFEKRTSNLN